MLDHYFVRPRTVDRIRGLWLGPAIEQYVDWMWQRHAAGRPSRPRFSGSSALISSPCLAAPPPGRSFPCSPRVLLPSGYKITAGFAERRNIERSSSPRSEFPLSPCCGWCCRTSRVHSARCPFRSHCLLPGSSLTWWKSVDSGPRPLIDTATPFDLLRPISISKTAPIYLRSHRR